MAGGVRAPAVRIIMGASMRMRILMSTSMTHHRHTITSTRMSTAWARAGAHADARARIADAHLPQEELHPVDAREEGGLLDRRRAARRRAEPLARVRLQQRLDERDRLG